MQLDEFYAYKNKLTEILCCNKDIVTLITGNKDSDVPNHILPYKNIFPFEYVPDTSDDASTYICFDVDVIDVEDDTFLVPALYIWVFTHKSKLRLPEGGLLLDDLTVEINKELNGNRMFGLGKLRLKNVGRFVPIDDYQGKVITYIARDFNKPTPKRIPNNRRLDR